MNHWNQLSQSWQACLQEAWEAYCCGSIPIGSAVVGPDGEVLSTGRNHMWEPYAVGPQFLSGTRLAHAEVNALLAVNFDALSINPRECTLYTTTEPCPMCAGALVMTNVRHVCYGSQDPWAGASSILTTDPYILSKKIRVEGPANRYLETFLLVLQNEFRLRDRTHRGIADPLTVHDPVIEAYKTMSPEALERAVALFRSGTLFQWAEQGCPVEEVYERV